VRLGELAARRCFRQPLERVREQERRLDEWAERLGRAARQRLESARQRLAAVAGQLETLSPLNVLARGYSLTQTEAGEVVRRPGQVRPGERLRTRVSGGELVSRVEQTITFFEPEGRAEA
jgi:exodeoxyribonuclease VII large subunit